MNLLYTLFVVNNKYKYTILQNRDNQTMECTRCHERKDISEFSLKNKKEGIYYLHCDDCRKYTLQMQYKYKNKAKDEYEIKKITNVIECECGKSFVSFRDYHIYRHVNSQYHINYISCKNR